MKRPRLPTMHEVDLQIRCPARDCLRGVGKECKGTKPGIVHFARRLKRLLVGNGIDWREAVRWAKGDRITLGDREALERPSRARKRRKTT